MKVTEKKASHGSCCKRPKKPIENTHFLGKDIDNFDALSDIKNDLKQAMLDKDNFVRDTLRLFMAEVQRFEIDNKEEVDDAKAVQIINKMIKQRNDSISQFKNGDRMTLLTRSKVR